MPVKSTPRLLILIIFQCVTTTLTAQWKPAPGPLTTPWTAEVSPQNALPEYPRPQMERKDWQNLNGLWNFTLTDNKTGKMDAKGQILVPYPVESSLSGIGRKVLPSHSMTYNRTVSLPSGWIGKRVLLHFGAVDWETEVFVNNKKVGEHRGGYDPFFFDISKALTPDGEQEITVKVSDPTNSGGQPIGKQHLQPHGIWYTGVSGIWQTVWLEPVAETFIRRYRVEPDIDKKRAIVKVEADGNMDGKRVTARVIENSRIVANSSGRMNTPLLLNIPDARLWSPTDPYLYELDITIEDPSNKTLDRVRGYFGMRKTSLGKDANGITRLMLNNEFVFQLGPLDQGFFPDGLYTPPTEAAMKFDLETLKNMGFNMIRKHVKAEPARWYYLCDKMGFLVWQDMPSAKNESPEDREQFKAELKAMVDGLYNHPSIVMWVPFNEGWGQHDTEFFVEQVRQWDPTRLVNNASGWTDRKAGDVMDIHDYPGPSAPPVEENRAAVLGEFGGLGLNVKGHQWTNTGWGYDLIPSPEELLVRYENLYRNLIPLIDKGLSAAVYTQVSDIETENNGLMTYDRKVVKMDAALVALAHKGCMPPQPPGVARVFSGKTKIALQTIRPGAEIRYSFDENLPQEQWKRYTAPVPLSKTKSLFTKATWTDGSQSRTQRYDFQKVKPIKSKKPSKLQPGLLLNIYHGSWDSLPDFKTLTPVATKTVSTIDLSEAGREEDYGLVFEGWVEVSETSAYTFGCSSDDGSRLSVAGQLLINNDGIHGMKERSATLVLKKGKHPFRLEFFQKKGGQGLSIWWEGKDGKRGEIPQKAFWKETK
jgi:hypothetical protein